MYVAGYSGTPLAKKLGIKEGHRVGVLAAPPGFERTLSDLPGGATVVREAAKRGALDVAVLFVKSRAELERRFEKAAASLTSEGGLWVAWPKKASGVVTDMTEHAVRDVALPKGLVDNKVCAIDDVWSGLRLVYRLENRPRLEAAGRAKQRAPSTPRAAPKKEPGRRR